MSVTDIPCVDAPLIAQMNLLSGMFAVSPAPDRVMRQSARILRRDGFVRAYRYVAEATGAGPLPSHGPLFTLMMKGNAHACDTVTR